MGMKSIYRVASGSSIPVRSAREQIIDPFGIEQTQTQRLELPGFQFGEPLANAGRSGSKPFFDQAQEDLELTFHSAFLSTLRSTKFFTYEPTFCASLSKAFPNCRPNDLIIHDVFCDRHFLRLPL